jgi:hypothetical protein
MKCTRVEKFLPLYITGDLTGRRRRRRAVENHLSACEKCRLAAGEYRASRELFRAAALSPDFDAAFYEEIRTSVLAQIRRDRTPAPPSRFSTLFNARLAYAASFALLFIVAALALHNYPRRTPEDGTQQKLIAGEDRARPTVPATIKTPPPTPPESKERPIPRPLDESARVAASSGRRAPKSPLPGSHAKIESAQTASLRGLHVTSRAPSRVRRNSPALPVAATAQAEAIAAQGASGRAANALPEVSHIEIQTSDPNIRIIWLSPDTKDQARPLK